MKIGFTDEGLSFNSKKFDPLNINVNGHGIENTREENQLEAFSLLEKLANVELEEDKINRLKILKSVFAD